MNKDRPKFLIVYDKPSSSDYEGREHYSSDSGTETAYNIEAVIKFCVDLMGKEHEGSDYEIKIYKDGCSFDEPLQIYNSDCNIFTSWWGGDEDTNNDPDVKKIIWGIRGGMDRVKKDRAKKKRKEEANDKRIERASKEREFNRLKKELGK